MAEQFKACAVNGCNGDASWSAYGLKGYCCKHYNRLRRTGRIDVVNTRPGEAIGWLEDHSSYSGDDCLIWPFAKSKNGYGAAIYKRTRMNPSRVMCILAHGEPPSDIHEAAHKCGRGSSGCVNPQHLERKTPTENAADKALHGTNFGGEDTPAAKLTWTIVREIRAMAGTMPMTKIGERFGVNRSTVGYIIRGDTWKE